MVPIRNLPSMTSFLNHRRNNLWAPGAESSECSRPQGSTMHALIIEQDAWVVLMIEDALTELGYTSFDIAATDAEALAMAAKRCPDLITSDVRLGSSCGIETVRSICSTRYIPVVFVTSTGWEVRQRSKELAVVQKPFRSDDLKSAIAKAVSLPPSKPW